MKQRTVNPFAVVIVIALAVSLVAAERGPQGVSPGATDRLSGISLTCPTFTWEATNGAQRYDLVVYRIDPDSLGSDALDLAPDNEVLYNSVSGRATGWTPESSECFVSGESYVWFVRAVMDAEGARSSEWSEPRFFEVAAAPSAEELERAIEVIRRWDAANGDGSLILSADAAPAAVPAAAAVSDADSDTDSDTGSAAPKSVITGTAAIRGEQPDFSGETYGVVGINASPDGAGIGASNVTGGPDLVLDGPVPAEITESRIDRPSASPQTFSVTNTGGGGMTLDIEGAEVLTTASAVDADTLDGIDGTDFATDVEAAALVMTHAASSDHDGRYFTETELGTSGAGGSVHWDNLGGVPAGFADGVDDDTTYSFGSGLMVDNDQIVFDPAFFSPRVTMLDDTVGGGADPSIAIGADGLGLIAYYDQTNADLKVAHCDNVLCTSATTATLDSAGNVGGYTSIAIGADGLGLISYFDSTPNSDLKVAHCDNILCTSATTATLDSAGNVGGYTSIAIGADGLGLISYFDSTPNYDLKVAHCSDIACTSATTTTLDSAGVVGNYTSIAIGADGLGLISYHDSTNKGIKVAHCDDIPCTSATLSTIGPGFCGSSTAIAVGADGLGIVAYSTFQAPDFVISAAHCHDTLCSSATSRTVDSAASVGEDVSVAIGADGFPVIGYFLERSGSPFDLRVAHCREALCELATIQSIESSIPPNWYGISIAIGADGLPLVSFVGVLNYGLKVAHLPYGY